MNERIKFLRKKLNLTQQEFADRLRIKRNTVATYEAGKSNPSDGAVSLICREFNVNEEWLRHGTGEMFFEIDREDQIMEWAGTVLREESTSFRKRFVAALSKLNEKDWEVLEKLVLALAEEKETSGDQSN